MKKLLLEKGRYVGMFLFPIITFYLFDGYTHNAFTSMKLVPQLLNIFFFEMSMLFLFGLFGRLHIALMVQTGLFMVIGLANYFVLSFRSAPIMPWDILSLKTAASVANNFEYTLEGKTILILLGFLVLLVLEFFCRFSLKNIKLRFRFTLLATSFFFIWGFSAMLHQESAIRKLKLYDKLFTPTVMSKRCGNSVAFIMELKYLSVEKPADYQSSDAARTLSSFEDMQTVSGQTPNIIVIMNEAFSDPAVLGDFTTNEDYMPFVHNLMEGDTDTVSGYLDVSVLGGNTANTEFEFLTGHTMAFLPQGSVPYQQYLKGPHPSIASHLKSLGYSTIAMHPYHRTGWERDRVYPELGFDEMYFLDNFTNIDYIRKYTSDKTCYDKIIDLYENKETGQPLFVFNVTMQNHSSYSEDFENFHPDITVEGIDSPTLNRYLSLMKLSDEAFADFVSYFKEQEEDTILIMFGDHQPTKSVTNTILKKNGKSPDTLTDEEEALYYKVPYVIWANFDIPEETKADTSSNYLAADILELSGIKLPAYQNYLKTLQKDIPILSTQTSIPEDKKDILNTYKQLQYYLLFDWEK